MQAKIINGEVYLVKGLELYKPKTTGADLELRYKIWISHMEEYCKACDTPPFSSEIVEGKVYDISDRRLALV
jgi:hypothetical protein